MLNKILDWNGIIEFIIVLIMLRCVFPLRVKGKKSAVSIGLVWLLFVTGNSAVHYLLYFGWINTRTAYFSFVILLSVLPFFYGLYALDTDKRQCLSTLLFFINNVLLSYMIVVVYLFDSSLWHGKNMEMPGHIIAYLFLILIAFAYRKVTERVTVKLSGVYWVVAILIPVMLIFLTELWDHETKSYGMFWTGIILMILDFAVYFLFMRIVGELQNQMELTLTNQQLAFQVRQMDNVKDMLEHIRKERHELKSNYFYIETLLYEKCYDEVLSYLHDVVAPSMEKDEIIHTGNRLVDMILSQKVGEARRSNIPIVLNVLLPERIEMNQQMLCSLLFNLLDNAIEASKKTKEPDIQFSMHKIKDYLKIEIRNKISETVLGKNAGLKTSKKDREHHGIGMKIIRQIVKRYDGDLKIWEEEGYFIVNVFVTDRAV